MSAVLIQCIQLMGTETFYCIQAFLEVIVKKGLSFRILYDLLFTYHSNIRCCIA
jgi:hypothetical protein